MKRMGSAYLSFYGTAGEVGLAAPPGELGRERGRETEGVMDTCRLDPDHEGLKSNIGSFQHLLAAEIWLRKRCSMKEHVHSLSANLINYTILVTVGPVKRAQNQEALAVQS